ncbi:MAG: hypothetical protein ACI85F_002569 [Bacteroidia bacterium]
MLSIESNHRQLLDLDLESGNYLMRWIGQTNTETIKIQIR